jgi:hypothetical protein
VIAVVLREDALLRCHERRSLNVPSPPNPVYAVAGVSLSVPRISWDWLPSYSPEYGLRAARSD